MSPQKTKNLIILILVLVNLFLLALVVPEKLAAQRDEQQALARLSQLYEDSGIFLDVEILPEEKTLYPLTMVNDLQAQEAAIAVLLGDSMTRTQAGDSLRFTANGGSAELQGSLLNARLSLPAEEPLAFTRRLLEQMDLSYTTLQETKIAGSSFVAARLQIQDVPILGEGLVFAYENGVLTTVSGLLLPASSPLYAAQKTPGLGLWDALVKFRSSRITTGWMGSSVTTVEQGYLLSPTADGRGFFLRPQWRMETDMGPYLVDGISGEVTANM